MGVVYNSIPSSSVTITGAVVGAVSPQKADAVSGRTGVVQYWMGCSGEAANTVFTVYTPTVGKTLYVTQMTFSDNTASYVRVGDNISGNAVLAGTGVVANCVGFGTGAANMAQTVTFDVPMEISTALKLISSGVASRLMLSFVGWEE